MPYTPVSKISDQAHTCSECTVSVDLLYFRILAKRSSGFWGTNLESPVRLCDSLIAEGRYFQFRGRTKRPIVWVPWSYNLKQNQSMRRRTFCFLIFDYIHVKGLTELWHCTYSCIFSKSYLLKNLRDEILGSFQKITRSENWKLWSIYYVPEIVLRALTQVILLKKKKIGQTCCIHITEEKMEAEELAWSLTATPRWGWD